MTATHRMIERRGKTFTMKRWVTGAVDTDYGRTTSNDTLETTGTTFKAILSETAKERVVVMPSGEERTVDAQLIVKNTLDVSDIDDTTKRAPVIISPDGLTYDAIALGREGEVVKVRRIFLLKRRANA